MRAVWYDRQGPAGEVLQVGELPADLAWGAVSPLAGHAAYRYIEEAARYAVAGAVSAIATAPINKAALHAAGHVFPGHTELLAHESLDEAEIYAAAGIVREHAHA